ncbi:MAG: SDR family oxidoreductase [Pirellulaceae bacterium]
MAKVVVTGGAGFIGSHLVQALVERGDRVCVLDNFSTSHRRNLAPWLSDIEVVEGDACDANAVASAVRGAELVFHEAALASVQLSVESPLASHAHCTTSTLTVLDQARRAGVRRFVYAASSSAYGNSLKPAKQEADPLMPLSPYAAAKLSGELFCQAYYHTYGFETVCLRYFNVFGPRQDPKSPYSAVIPIFITAMLAGQRPTVFGDGHQSRDFVFVHNVVHANLLAAATPAAAGQVFNVGCGQSVSLLDLIGRLNQRLGTRLEPDFQPARAGDVQDSLADISLATAVLGYRPLVSFDEGLRQSVEFYRSA